MGNQESGLDSSALGVSGDAGGFDLVEDTIAGQQLEDRVRTALEGSESVPSLRDSVISHAHPGLHVLGYLIPLLRSCFVQQHSTCSRRDEFSCRGGSGSAADHNILLGG